MPVRSATKSLSRALVHSASSYAHGGRNDRPPRAASSWLEMHEAVSGQRSRRPSRTPRARAARGVAASTNAAARLARRGSVRRWCGSGGATALATSEATGLRGRALATAGVASVRGVGLRSDAHCTNIAVASHRYLALVIFTESLARIETSHAMLGTQCHCATVSAAARVAILPAAAVELETIQANMLLHKIGSLLGSAPAGQAPRVRGRLCRATVVHHAVGRRRQLSRRCGA